MEKKPGDGAPGKKSEEKPKSESIDKAGKSEQETETPTASLDKRKLKAKEQNVDEVPVELSPSKRKCPERYVLASGKIEPTEKQLKAYEQTPGTSAADVGMQGSPKRLPSTETTGVGMQGSPNRSPVTQAAGVGIQGSPKQSPAISETHFTPLQLKQLSSFSSSYRFSSSKSSADGVGMQGSPKRSPTITETSAAGVSMPGSPKRSKTIPETSAASVSMQEPRNRSPIPGTSEAGVTVFGSPKRSPTISGKLEAGIVMPVSPKRSKTIPETTAAGVVMPGSPKRSPSIPETSAAGVIMQGSPIRSPTKRTYKERQLTFSVDELGEKRIKEESGYQSDSALDLRKDFKKQMPSSTHSPEHDCQPTSSDQMGELVEKRPEEKCATESNFLRDPKTASSDVGEAHVSSTSNESVESSTGEPGAQGCKVQNVAEANKKEKSPRTSPQRSGARPKVAAGGSRSEDYIEVSYPRYSPSRLFYGEPTIRRISPQRVGPSCSDGGFKVPATPPPPEESDQPASNMLETMNNCIVACHAMVTAEQLREQMRKEKELKDKKRREQAENYAKAVLLGRETTKKLKEKEARLKGENKSSAEDKSDIAPDGATVGPSTSVDGMAAYEPEEYLESKSSMDKQATSPSKEENTITEPIAEKENLPAAQPSMRDENANIMEREPPQSAGKDDNENKSQTCTVQTNREGTGDDASPSAGGVVAQMPHEVPMNQEQVSLQQLVPNIGEISLDDSLENAAVADPREDDNADNDDKH